MQLRAMTDRRVNPLSALVASFALSLPVPAMAQDRTVMVANCLGGAAQINIPADPSSPTPHDCCGKGCHAVGDRRKKGEKTEEGCC